MNSGQYVHLQLQIELWRVILPKRRRGISVTVDSPVVNNMVMAWLDDTSLLDL